MKRLLLTMIPLISIIITHIQNSEASDYYIIDNNVLGCMDATFYSESHDNYLLDVINSLKRSNEGKGFRQKPEISRRFHFKNIPCVKMYSLWVGPWPYYSYEDPYEDILFNICDSSLYIFNGDSKDFSSVFHEYLDTDLKDYDYYEIISLYLNTFSIKNSVYPLKTIDDFNKIYETEFIRAMHYLNVDIEHLKKRWNYENDVELVNNILKPMEIFRGENDIIIKIYCWLRKGGELEFIQFKIGHGELSIIERKRILSNVGPFGRHN
ncbi:MAG: hypothetical protein JSW64_14630 [Candidatus Zixiibacteriota bacterium]|nr:MAG: hypothetical protein JSW64_14630 [candidate division Zixibacteria bacterium]